MPNARREQVTVDNDVCSCDRIAVEGMRSDPEWQARRRRTPARRHTSGGLVLSHVLALPCVAPAAPAAQDPYIDLENEAFEDLRFCALMANTREFAPWTMNIKNKWAKINKKAPPKQACRPPLPRCLAAFVERAAGG